MKCVLGELNLRLKRTKVDGKLLIAEQAHSEWTLDPKTLSYEAYDALVYVSGSWRKRMSYYKWKSQRHYRNEDKKYSKT